MNEWQEARIKRDELVQPRPIGTVELWQRQTFQARGAPLVGEAMPMPALGYDWRAQVCELTGDYVLKWRAQA
jgi:hypothetical protein